MNTLSVSATLKVVIGVLVAALLAVLSNDAWEHWGQLRASARIEKAADASSHMFTALHNLRVDRATTINQLASDQTITTPTAMMAATRSAEMPAIQAAIQVLKTIDFPQRAERVAALERAHERLAALQVETLAAMGRPKGERKASLSQDYQTAATEMLDLLAATSSDVTKLVKLDDPMIDRLFDIKQLAWAARGSAGDAALIISFGLSGRPVPADAPVKYQVHQGKAEASWAGLMEAAAGVNMPARFTEAVKKAQATYFDKTYQEGQFKLVTTLASGQKAGLTSDDWTPTGVGNLANILAVAEAALEGAKHHAEQAYAGARVSLTVHLSLLIGSIVVATGMMWMVSRRVIGPLGVLRDRMLALAQGDLTVEAPFTERRDEIGALGKTMATFRNNMLEAEQLRANRAEQENRAAAQRRAEMAALADKFDQAVGGIVDMVASAATELQGVAKTLTASAEQTSAQSNTVASASEQASSNVASVASATEELSASVSEISRQVAQSASISAKAVSEAALTNERVKGLAAAADKIGSIVGLINEIAGRTNLLALNATIEAARAGDAGKGFAVVASEVKQLADQTAKATAEISSQIGAIQEATAEAAHAIEEIGSTIETMNAIAGQISTAMQDQGSATSEIARNVQEASHGTAHVSRTITTVTAAASESTVACEQVLLSAGELSRQAETLRAAVGDFLATVRTAA